MMKLVRKILSRFVIGMGFGSMAYLLVLVGIPKKVDVSLVKVLWVFFFSGLIGELTFVIDTELPFLLALFLHFIGVFGIYLAMMSVCQWPITARTLVIFIVIYIIIWLIVCLTQEYKVKQINLQISKKKQK